uniref:Ribosomal protein L14 n=1 Tax=Peronospora tabacina TaxID=230439 RepID=A0A0P0H915_9STRA|nr:ribosomal protein L14 [Peronospora tabacina]ALJ78450.1 ribosomal protein L14 [Peronospora tabacina]ALJ78497.1 ribosomal protein L14 [Peronospora tabacina]
MIQIQTKLKINDNSGIKIGQCIKIYKKKVGKMGDIILISAKKLRLNKKKKIKIIKGDLFKALIIHTKYQKMSTIGNILKFDKNSIIILNNQNKPLGTRIFGPITSEFRKQKQFKILSLASNIL